jgi:DNA polymerase III subunit beta
MPSITVEPKALADALAAVRPALGRRPAAVEALSGVRLTATDAGTELSTTDMDVCIRRALPDARCDGKLDLVVAHHELADVARVLGRHPEIRLALEPGVAGEVLACSHEQRKVTLQTLRLEDFPACPGCDGRHLFTANGAELAASLERVGRFASTDDTRPMLCAISIDWNDDLMLVATDSYRLAVIPAPAAPKARKRVANRRQPDPNRVTIGRRGLLLAAKAMRNVDSVRVLAASTHAIVQWQSTIWTIRLVDGSFPNWRQLIPEEFRHKITIPVPELVQACELAATFSTNGTPARLLANSEVKLHGNTRSGPSFEEIFDGATAQLADVDTFEIGFNAEFLRSIARAYEADTAVVRLIAPNRAVVFEDQEDRYLLMPITLD